SSIGPIVGGVVGGILVIAIAVFLFVRRRRQNTPKPTDSTELAQLSTDANKFDGTDQGHGQYDQGNVQYVQGHVPYEQGYLQPDQGCVQHEQEYVAYEQGYPQPPSIIPPPPTVNRNITDSAYKVPAEPEVTPASPTATSSSYVSPTSYRDSTFSPGSPESVVEKADRFSVSNAPHLPIPVYNEPCLAADSSSTVPTFYLVGSSSPGSLEVNYVNNPEANTVTRVAIQNDQSAWTPNAAKLCYIYPFATSANPGIKIVQFGSGSTFMALAQTDNIVSGANSFSDTGFMSPKLFAWSGKFQDFDIFTVLTNDTVAGTSKIGTWAGLRLNFRLDGSSILTYALGNEPNAHDNVLLTVGTYATSSGDTSYGYTVVFDKTSKGQIFPTQGSRLADLNNTLPLVSLERPGDVNMNGIALTASAIPITMGAMAYILDKGFNGATVIYSIDPSTSYSLNRISMSGGSQSLPFTNIKAIAALNNQILTYSSNGTAASFNVFDLSTSTWSGSNLVSAPGPGDDPTPAKSSTSGGAIVGGVVGCLVVIAALAAFLFLRRRRQSAQKSADDVVRAQKSPNVNKPDGTDQGHVHYDPGHGQYAQEYVPYDQGYIQHDQGYIAYDQRYPQPPSFIPPPLPPPLAAATTTAITPAPLIIHDEDVSYKVPAATEADDTPASPTMYSASYISPTSYRDSTFAPRSPESVINKSEILSIGHSPQYVPNALVAVSEARSPQLVSI
ncbi:hypothetical protein BGZ95_009238, partial [Linnemannia exigua]